MQMHAPKVGANDLGHLCTRYCNAFITVDHRHCGLSLLAFQKHGVAGEETQFFHLRRINGDRGVIIIDAVIYQQNVRGVCLAQDGGG